MGRFDTWDSYLWVPGGTVLRNLQDERDGGYLQRLEYHETFNRQREILTGKVDIPRTYDADHLRAIHRHLFGNLYEWAGEYRSVNMGKPGAPAAFAHTSAISTYLEDAHSAVQRTDWRSLDRDGFAERASATFAYINHAHPFREGNGRTAKVFMEHVAEQSGFTLEYSRVPPAAWNQASMLSAPDLGMYEPDRGSLVPVFRELAQPATTENAPNRQGASGVPSVAEEVRRQSAQMFPTSARAAMRSGSGARARVVRGTGAEKGSDQGLSLIHI